MPRFLTRPALAFLGTLLCLAACAPAPSPGNVGHTPTVMPARVPAGWKMLAAAHSRLTYPPGWTPVTMYDPKYYPADMANTAYFLNTPDGHYWLDVSADANVDVSAFCPVATPTTQQFQPTTLAGLPVHYLLVPSPNGGGKVRWWVFLNAQRTSYTLRAYDGDASATTQAQDDAILATFRPDNATPWKC